MNCQLRIFGHEHQVELTVPKVISMTTLKGTPQQINVLYPSDLPPLLRMAIALSNTNKNDPKIISECNELMNVLMTAKIKNAPVSCVPFGSKPSLPITVEDDDQYLMELSVDAFEERKVWAPALAFGGVPLSALESGPGA